MGYLTLITLIPLAGAVIIMCIPKGKVTLIKQIAAVATGITFVLTVIMLFQFNTDMAGINQDADSQSTDDDDSQNQ